MLVLVAVTFLSACKEQASSSSSKQNSSSSSNSGSASPAGMPSASSPAPSAGAPSANMPKTGTQGRDSQQSTANGKAAGQGQAETAASEAANQSGEGQEGLGAEPSDDVALEDLSAEQGMGDADGAFDVFEQAAVAADSDGLGDGESEGLSDSRQVASGGEELGELEGELDVALGEFDGVILAGRQAAVGQENSRAGQSTSNRPTSSGASDNGYQIPNAPQAGSGSGGGSLPNAAPSNNSASDGNSDKNVPEDIGDGNDDDVVARQIREAAQREQDPELRDKLWDEYRKYKSKG